ncbi:transmembrane protein 69 [Mantella aurantiaca]
MFITVRLSIFSSRPLPVPVTPQEMRVNLSEGDAGKAIHRYYVSSSSSLQIFKGTSPVCRQLFSPPLAVRLHRRPPAPPLSAINLTPPPLSAINLTPPPLSAINLPLPPLSAINLTLPPLSAINLTPPPLSAINLTPPPLSAINLTPPPLSAINLTARRELHTSSRRQKRKREAKESLLLPAVLRNWQAIKASPRPALVLGLLGSAPFVAPPLAMCVTQLYHPGLAAAQVLYGACVLSFLGGVRWGYALPDGSPARVNWINLATGALCPYLAFVGLLLMEDVGAAILGLGAGFCVSLAADVLGVKVLDLAPISPLWYKWLRGLLTAVVLASFLATLWCSSRYPREEPTAPPGKPKRGL